MNLLNSKLFWGSLIVILAVMALLREYGEVTERQQQLSRSPWPEPTLIDYAKPIPPVAKVQALRIGKGNIDSAPPNESKNLEKNSENGARPIAPILYKGRTIIGQNNLIFKTNPNIFPMANRVNKEWKSRLTESLTKFQPKNVQVKVEHKNSYLQIEQDQGRYLEAVFVETIFADGKANSFNALVDSESGRIVDSWDWSRYENININTNASTSLKSNKIK